MKVIQIAASGSRAVALGDDGSMWLMSDGRWTQLPAVPATDVAWVQREANRHTWNSALEAVLDVVDEFDDRIDDYSDFVEAIKGLRK